MKKALKIPPKPSKQELEKLLNRFHLPGWQFDKLIGDHCTEISTTTIEWQKDKSIKAIIYGLRAQTVDTKKSCIANFFVHYQSRVYQSYNIEGAIETVKLIEKEYEFDKYQSKLWRQRYEARKKAKILKLKSAKEKAA